MPTQQVRPSSSPGRQRWRRCVGVVSLGLVMMVPVGCRAKVGACTIVWGEPGIFQTISPNPSAGAAGGIADLFLSLVPFPVCGDQQNQI